MGQAKQVYQQFVASLNILASTDPTDLKVAALVQDIDAKATQMIEFAAATAASRKDDDFTVVASSVESLHNSVLIPCSNYRRIATITSKLRGLVKLAGLPQNASLRPQIQEIVKKTAGVFAEVDTVDDLNKPLEQIEKAVHKLYGDQNSSKTYNFEERGKGFHGKGDK